MSRDQPPGSDELEFSLFGPGIGECAVVHLGNGKWMTVDSCLDETGLPVALTYLQRLGVDIEKSVQVVAVTHWHDDHCRGVHKLLCEASHATFMCSAALRTREFVDLVAAAEGDIHFLDHSPGTGEFARIFGLLGQVRKGTAPKWLNEGSIAYLDESIGVSVVALSPSDATITDAKVALGQLFPRDGEQIGRIRDISPNDVSAVLLVRTPGVSVILGGDLPSLTASDRGWRAVIASRVRPSTRSIGFKVAHHGSENADCPEIWSELLAPQVAAFVAPYGRGRKALPAQSDVVRMLQRTSSLYCTVWPPMTRPTKRDKAVERTMNEVSRNRRASRRIPGHLRLRIALSGSGDARIETFDGGQLLHSKSPYPRRLEGT